MKKPLLLIGIMVLASFFFPSVNAQDDWRDALVCSDGTTRPCGSNLGVCEPGVSTCAGGSWGPCIGGTEPQNEVCDNNLDDDCNGEADDCYFEFPVPGWMLISIGVIMFLGAWVYEKMVVVKKEEANQEEPESE